MTPTLVPPCDVRLTDPVLAGLYRRLRAGDDVRPLLADRYDDLGLDGRGELIRVACELTRLDGGTRCPVCHWPYRSRSDGGCRPGDCSFRPTERSGEYDGWKKRMNEYTAIHRRRWELSRAYIAACPECLEDADFPGGVLVTVRGPEASLRRHLPRLGAELLGPVAVAVTDREVYFDRVEAWWMRRGDCSLDDSNVLPDDVFDRLTDGVLSNWRVTPARWRSYFGPDRVERATADLSNAVLSLCRDRAGLR